MMKIELISVKSLENNQFEIVTKVDGEICKHIVKRNTDVFLRSINENLTYFTSENRDFSDIWGNSFELRKEISEKIDEMVKQTELQPI